MWTLKVELERRGKKEAKRMQIDSTASFKALHELIRETFQIGKRNKFNILHGFPPRVLNVPDKNTPITDSGIQNADVLKLKTESIEAAAERAAAQSSALASAPQPAARTKQRIPKTGLAGFSLRRPRTKDKMRNQGEVGEKLASSVAGSKRQDVVSRFMRSLYREGVQKQYDIREAHDRYQAALLGQFRIEESSEPARRLGDGDEQGVQAIVHYKKGRSVWNQDQVFLYSEPVLKGLFEHILQLNEEDDAGTLAKEKLRPQELALTSVNVFWSLVRFHGKDLEDGMRKIYPEGDWQFLDSRRRNLSSKAKQARQLELRLTEEREARKRRKTNPKSDTQSTLDTTELENDGATSSDKNNDDETANSQRIEQIDVSRVIADDQTVKWLKDIGVSTVMQLADFDPDDAVSSTAQSKAIELSTFIQDAQEYLVPQMLESIVLNKSLLPLLAEKCGIVSPFDLFRLRVPGRVEFVVEELNGNVDNETVRKWQKQGQNELEHHVWLKHWRSRNG